MNWYKLAQQKEFQSITKDMPDEQGMIEDYVSDRDEAIYNVIKEYKNSKPGDRQPWPVVPFGRVRKIWNDYSTYGVVHDTRGIDEIASRMIKNIQRLYANTYLSGHTTLDPKEELEEQGMDKEDDLERFYWEYSLDDTGQARISDYAMDKLENDALDLAQANTSEQKLLIIDRMFNRIHQRSDIAAMFIEGGSDSLTELFGFAKQSLAFNLKQHKKAQNKNYASWLAKEILRITDNYSRPLSSLIKEKDFPILENWVRETNPDLSDLLLGIAISKSHEYQNYRNREIENEYSPEQINRNWNKFISETQNFNPNSPNFAVDLRKKNVSINASTKNKINKAIHLLGNFHAEIPLQSIFNILKEKEIVALQEDGRKWSGLLIGGAECGSEKAKDQYAQFTLAVNKDNQYVPAKQKLILNWCVMSSGRYEIVSYVS